MIEQLDCGAWVIANDTHHKGWIQEKGKLTHDEWFCEQVTRHIKPGDQAIDIGANVGTITRAMIDAGASVLAFEPNMEAVDCLLRNCPEALVSCLALSDCEGSIGFEIDENAGASHVNYGRIFGGMVQTSGLDSVCSWWDIAQGKERQWLPSVIKIDAEGSEARILRGGRSFIARCKPVMILEVNRGALERSGDSEDILLALVEELGYRWEIIQPQCRRGDEQFDIRCVPK